MTKAIENPHFDPETSTVTLTLDNGKVVVMKEPSVGRMSRLQDFAAQEEVSGPVTMTYTAIIMCLETIGDLDKSQTKLLYNRVADLEDEITTTKDVERLASGLEMFPVIQHLNKPEE